MAKRDASVPRLPGTPRAASASPREATASATIAIYSVKGGVGKTTIAANLAWCAAEAFGRSTLLWDLDAAGGSGFLYGHAPDAGAPVQSVFSRDQAPRRSIRATGIAGLDILPADESIRALDQQLARIGKRKRLARLAEDLGERYQRIILDCPPVLNELSAQVMRAADLVIVPLPPSPLSARAFDLVVREVAGEGRRHPPILPVLSMLDLRRALHREARDEHPDWPAIPYASVVEQGAVRQRPVGALAPQHAVTRRFVALWSAIEAKLAAIAG